VEKLLEKANITVNKNTIPFETQKPFVTSGIRVGTPAVTTRGMGEAEMASIADWIATIVREGEDAVPAVKEKVLELCGRFPLYE
jgi:glycine hydroxymethyltransferase